MWPSRSTPLAADPTAHTAFHRPDDRFIPIRPEDLVSALAAEAAARGDAPDEFRLLAAAIRDVIDQETLAFANELESAYVPFSPDRDTVSTPAIAAARTILGYDRIFRQFAYLLNKANFARLSAVELEEAVQIACSRGLRVRLRPERIEELSVWVRGRDWLIRNVRDWRSPIRGRPVRVPVFRRMVVICRLRDDPHVLLKMFKEIPEDDVEALLPHADVEMNWWDRAALIGGSGGTIWTTGAKLLGGGLAALGNLIWVLVAGMAMLAWRAFRGYRHANRHRNWQRTQQLYFQNVANNLGAIYSLMSMTAQEEQKEALLLYAALRWDLPASLPQGASAASRGAGAGAVQPAGDPRVVELAAACGEWVRRYCGAVIDFDIHDAISTLDRLGLLAGGAVLAVPDPVTARLSLAEHWLARRSAGHHGERAPHIDPTTLAAITRETFAPPPLETP